MTLQERIQKTIKHYSQYNKQYFRNKLYDSRLRQRGEGCLDRKRFLDKFPGFGDFYIGNKGPFVDMITPYYRDYVSSVSSEIMAASFELSLFLLTFSKFTRPARILDFGSGFSSFILRLYSFKITGEKPQIWTVDDSPEWLAKTSNFLKKHNIAPRTLCSMEETRNLRKNSFDLIFYDFGAFDIRISTLDFALSLLSKKGNMIIDDMHAADYAFFVKDVACQRKMDSISLRYFTHDKFNRFSYLLQYGL
jgi:hypothetical protein